MDKNEEEKAAIVIKSIHTACNQYSWGFGKHKVCFWIITAKEFLIYLEQKLNEKKCLELFQTAYMYEIERRLVNKYISLAKKINYI